MKDDGRFRHVIAGYKPTLASCLRYCGHRYGARTEYELIWNGVYLSIPYMKFAEQSLSRRFSVAIIFCGLNHFKLFKQN